jgi:hypothetical protein
MGRPRKLEILDIDEVVAALRRKETTVEITTLPVIEIGRSPKQCGGNPTLAGTRTQGEPDGNQNAD